MKKALSMLLPLLLVLGLAACDREQPAVTTAPSAETTADPNALSIPLTADFGGYEFHTLTAGNYAVEDFAAEEESEIVLDNAQYKRKRKVEQDYNVKILQDTEVSRSYGTGPGYMEVIKQVNAGDTTYDLCLIAGYDVSALAYTGNLYDMASAPGIDLTKPWWDQNAIRSLAVKDVVFFTTGEITVSDNTAAFCMLFNKDILSRYGLPSPYETVYKGEWTIENFAKLARSVSEDLDQDGKFTPSDLFGVLIWDDTIVGMVNAAGQRCCTINESGEIELTLYNETTLSALEQFANIAYDKQHALQFSRYSVSEKPLWRNNQSLLYTGLVKNIPEFRDMESDFGILPYPKLTAEQENHYTTIAPWHSQFICLPLVQEDIERTGVLVEALAYYGKEVVLPAFYDITLVGQASRDEESEGMLDIIFGNLIYDIGYYYQIGSYNEGLINQLRAYSTDFASMYDKSRSKAEAKLALINEFYSEAVAEWQ